MTAPTFGPTPDLPESEPVARGATAAAPEDHERLFSVLDRYLEQLHAGDVASRSGLVEAHPEFTRWLRCLELLERLAPPSPITIDERPHVQPPVDGAPSASQPFGKYELLDEIGRGGMGVVYRARQTDLDRTVALKMILSSRLASSEDVRRFNAEARAAGRLRHPNIVGIHEAGEVHGQHFFAMELVDGQSLAQALRGGPFDPHRAAQCVAAVGRAVQFLHEHQIIHRDLKPSNILLAADGTPFVTDFGLAKALGADSADTQTGAIIGTLGYMAPEQALGDTRAVSPRSDVYSLGAILFELLTGRTPFGNASPIDMLLQVLDGEPPRPTQLNKRIPPALEWICLKCLEKDPGNRYETAAALVTDLERFLQGEPLGVGPPGVLRSLLRWSRREPTLASHLGALAIASTIVQARYLVAGADLGFHLFVMGIFGVWALLSVACHRLMRGAAEPGLIQYAWAAADVFCLTWLLKIAEPPPGPLLVGYPLLIVASGLFFRVRLVAFITALCVPAYLVLILIGNESLRRPHYTLIYIAVLIVIGLIVGYQAYRIRVLSRYLENK